MTEKTPFSERHGFKPQQEPDITVRLDAPKELRDAVIILAVKFGIPPDLLRIILCDVLLTRPNNDNWSECSYDDVNHQLLDGAVWYKVYDVIEEVCSNIKKIKGNAELEGFASALNNYFVENGIGWKLVGGSLEARNPEALEQNIKDAVQALKAAGHTTAPNQLHKALVSLSCRPKPEVIEAIRQSTGALECVFRDMVGNPKATLGDLLKKYPKMVPSPLGEALEKIWGYSSEYARHLREGREPEFSEAQLVVGVCAAVVTYLIAKKLKEDHTLTKDPLEIPF